MKEWDTILEKIVYRIKSDARLQSSFGLAMNDKELWDLIIQQNYTSSVIKILEPELENFSAKNNLATLIPELWSTNQIIRFIKKYNYKKKQFSNKYQKLGKMLNLSLFEITYNPKSPNKVPENIFKNTKSIHAEVLKFLSSGWTKEKLYQIYTEQKRSNRPWQVNWILSRMNLLKEFRTLRELNSFRKILLLPSEDIIDMSFKYGIHQKNIKQYPILEAVLKDRAIEGMYEFSSINWDSPIKESDLLFLSYDQCCQYIHAVKFKNTEQFYKWRASEKRPLNIPSNPNLAYEGKGWVNWGEFLGTGRSLDKSSRLSLEEFYDQIRKSPINSGNQYRYWKDRPYILPSNPPDFYKDLGWISWDHALGKPEKVELEGLGTCKEYMLSQMVYSKTDWNTWCKDGNRPAWMPSDPNKHFKGKGWVSFKDFVGADHPQKVTPITVKVSSRRLGFLGLKEFFEFVRDSEIESSTQYRRWENRPKCLPSNPSSFYKNYGWTSWNDVFPKKTKKRPYKKAG